MKNYLFPSSCRLPGWILFVIGLVALPMVYYWPLSLSGILETVVIDTAVIATVLGALFIVCAKEPEEDEMTLAIRLSSLLKALYVYVAIIIAGTLFINGMPYLEFIAFNMVLFPIIFVVIFRVSMRKFYKQDEDEEQD
ncbi:MAG: hypothetical protein K2K93_06355 [Muribaculaceae bacterium]|nr:hypothetical protein [Muribaculaceae bacterium]